MSRTLAEVSSAGGEQSDMTAHRGKKSMIQESVEEYGQTPPHLSFTLSSHD